ncbi:MAG: small multi-drug export protein [Clostridiaceae bacterium]|nr:small multi-drug export protein [Clostridiaceae bacterium]
MEALLDRVTREIMVLLIAAMPLIELRGAIPIGISLGMHPLHATLLGILGSLIPVPLLLLFIQPIFDYLRNTALFKSFIDKTIKRTVNKSKKIQKYSVIGLILFVAIPLPSSGVWSGCLAASLFNIPFKYALPSIAVGASIAGIIMFILSYVVVSI